MFDRFKPRMIKFPENPQDSSSSKARRGARLWTPDRDEQKDAASVEEGSLDDVVIKSISSQFLHIFCVSFDVYLLLR